MQLITIYYASISDQSWFGHIASHNVKCFYCKQMDVKLDYVTHAVNYVAQ